MVGSELSHSLNLFFYHLMTNNQGFQSRFRPIFGWHPLVVTKIVMLHELSGLTRHIFSLDKNTHWALLYFSGLERGETKVWIWPRCLANKIACGNHFFCTACLSYFYCFKKMALDKKPILKNAPLWIKLPIISEGINQLQKAILQLMNTCSNSIALSFINFLHDISSFNL